MADELSTAHHFSVCVGIDCYPSISNLLHARKDAVAFDGWLATAGVPDANRELVLLPDGAPVPTQRRGAQPRVDEIWEAVKDKISRSRELVEQDVEAWAATRLYFFFSGHGIAPTARDAAGLAADCSAEDYGNSASLSAMIDYLVESGDFAEVVVVADSCRLEPAQGGVSVGRPPWTARRYAGDDDVKVATLYATQYRTAARESRDPDKERGYFTQALLEGLEGDPRAVQDGTITTGSLISFARQRVIDLTEKRQFPPRQVGATDIVLRTGTTAVVAGTRPVRLTLPAGLTGPVRLLDGTLAEVATHQPDGTAWSLPLTPGLYTLETAAGSVPGGTFRVDPGTEVLDVVV